MQSGQGSEGCSLLQPIASPGKNSQSCPVALLGLISSGKDTDPGLDMQHPLGPTPSLTSYKHCMALVCQEVLSVQL